MSLKLRLAGKILVIFAVNLPWRASSTTRSFDHRPHM
jgi:hypothetical protein